MNLSIFMHVSLWKRKLPFTIIVDETTDRYANSEVISVCLRFVDLMSHQNPHVFCLLSAANATSFSKIIKEAISDPSVSLDPVLLQSEVTIAGVQAKIKDVSPQAVYMHTLLFSPS